MSASSTSSASLTLSISTPVWAHWARIAVAQTALARQAASLAPAGSILDEMHPAMIAITAVAHTLDGLYDQLRFVAPVSTGRPKRQRRILETLKCGFVLGRKGQLWLPDFDALFALRDPAVHPQVKQSPPVTHPCWGNVAAEYVEYSADSAEWALGLLRDVLRTCVDNPRTSTRGWAEVQKQVIVREIGA